MENEKKLTIGFFNDVFYPFVDGVVQVVDNYARLLSKKANVLVFVPQGRDKHYKDAFPYEVVRSKRMRVFFLDYDLPLPQLDSHFKKILKNTKLDIVHIHSPFTIGKIGLEYAKKHHIPCVATMHSQFKRDFKRSVKTPLLSPIVSILMASIRSVFNNTTENWAVNGEVGRIFHEEYKVKNKPIVMLNGTDMQPVTDNAKIDTLRKKYNISPDEKVFLFVGRINILKNLPFLVRSLKILKEKHFPFKMIFVGTGQDEDLIKKQVKSLKMTKDVIFTGKITNREELACHYALADLFLFPSLYDCSSLVQIEAASQKTPALFLKGSATSDTITPEVNGYVSEHGELDYANKIIQVFSNEEKYNSVCQKALDDLYLTWPQVVEKAYQRYLYLIEENKKKIEKEKFSKKKSTKKAKKAV